MKVSSTIDIDAPADQAWEVIGPGFGRVGDWVAAIATSRPIGAGSPHGAPAAGRACNVTTPGIDQITEQLTDYDVKARRLTYRLSGGMTRLVSDAANTWQVRPLPGGRAEFRMDATVEFVGLARLAGPLARAYLTVLGRRTSRDLKTYVETGVPSRAKVIRVHASSRTMLDRLVLLNGLVSLTTGTALLGAAGWWSRQLGGAGTELVATVGIGLAGYAWVLARAAGAGVTPELGRLLALFDGAWVIGTVGLLSAFASQLTGTGLAASVGSGVVVAALGWGQWVASARVDASRGPSAAVEARPPTRHTEDVAPV
jgi:hypothetical protein